MKVGGREHEEQTNRLKPKRKRERTENAGLMQGNRQTHKDYF